MPITCSDALADIKQGGLYAETYSQMAIVHLNTADDFLDAFDERNAIRELIHACFDIVVGVRYNAYAFGDYSSSPALWWWLDNCAGGDELTWQSICVAWAKDDFEGAPFTIAFIDRMRQLIWDEPFFVAWASRPEEQELP